MKVKCISTCQKDRKEIFIQDNEYEVEKEFFKEIKAVKEAK